MLNRPADSRDEGEIVASTRDYEGAQKTVSKLIAQEVPARDIAIIGQSVRTVERITGRLGYAAAARSGAINGVLIGLFLSAILVIGNPEVPIQLFVGFVFIGVALGMLLSLVTYAIVRRRRDFASVTQFAADHYEVRVQATSLAKARLALGAAKPAPVRAPIDLDEPPRYGERIARVVSPPLPPCLPSRPRIRLPDPDRPRRSVDLKPLPRSRRFRRVPQIRPRLRPCLRSTRPTPASPDSRPPRREPSDARRTARDRPLGDTRTPRGASRSARASRAGAGAAGSRVRLRSAPGSGVCPAARAAVSGIRSAAGSGICTAARAAATRICSARSSRSRVGASAAGRIRPAADASFAGVPGTRLSGTGLSRAGLSRRRAAAWPSSVGSRPSHPDPFPVRRRTRIGDRHGRQWRSIASLRRGGQ